MKKLLGPELHELVNMENCIVCKREIKAGQAIVKDCEGDRIHEECFLDTLPADIRGDEINERIEERYVR